MPGKGEKWLKPTPEMIDLFDEVLPPDPHVARQKMFGFPAAFVNGNMFAWIHQNHITVRLPQKDREELVAEEKATPVDPTGKRMREYVSLGDKPVVDQDEVVELVHQAFAYVSSLPPKVKKPKKK
ncbi:TfoX/Sxy family protein [Amycolatopsis sp. cmx-11-12]|uniref:TfoX/Sxy family protein n=1 Tax=Amycolatopsis sp. cmx-11-12 TaxID=2785795 RepID=UPI003917E7E5